jgi:hypothetical protein
MYILGLRQTILLISERAAHRLLIQNSAGGMDTFLTRPGRWIRLVAVTLLAGKTARGGGTAVKEQLRTHNLLNKP